MDAAPPELETCLQRRSINIALLRSERDINLCRNLSWTDCATATNYFVLDQDPSSHRHRPRRGLLSLSVEIHRLSRTVGVNAQSNRDHRFVPELRIEMDFLSPADRVDEVGHVVGCELYGWAFGPVASERVPGNVNHQFIAARLLVELF